MKKKEGKQTAEGIRLQGTLLVCLAVAMIIAGGSFAAHHWFEASKAVNQDLNEEVTNDAKTEDTAELPDPVQSGDGGAAVNGTPEADPVAATGNPEPEGYCKIIMVGYGNDYSEVPTPENTVRMSVDICSELIGALAKLKEVGMLTDEEVTLPAWVTDTSS